MNNVIIAPNGELTQFMPKNGKAFTTQELETVVGGEVQIYPTKDRTRHIVMNFNGAKLPKLKPNPIASQFCSTETGIILNSLLKGNVAVIDVKFYQKKDTLTPQFNDKTSIYISKQEDFLNLSAWIKNHSNAYSYTPILPEGVIYLWSNTAIYFKEDNSSTHYIIYDTDYHTILCYFYRLESEHTVLANNMSLTDSDFQKYIRAMSFVHGALMSYMQKNITIRERVKKTIKSGGGITKVTTASGKSRFIPLQRIRYDISVEESPTDKKNQRHTLGWEVAGHLRKYRDNNGEVIKETFVKPHIKGDPSKAQPKKYKL